MNKSIIIVLSVFWVLCSIYLGLAKAYDYPYQQFAMYGAWAASALLLVCIIIFIRQNKRS